MSASSGRPAASGGAAHLKGVLLIFFTTFLWATIGIAQQMMTTPEPLDPAIIGLVRTALGGLVLLPVAAISAAGRTAGGRFPVRAVGVYAAGGAVFQVTLFESFQTIGVTITAVVTIVLPPILGAAWQALVTRSFARWVAAAIGSASLGTILALADHDGFALSSSVSPWYAAGLYVVNALGFLAVVDGLRRMTRVMSPTAAAGWGLTGVAVLLLPVSLVDVGPGSLAAMPHLPAQDIALLVYMGCLATGGAYAAFAKGLSLCRNQATGLAATMIEPIFAMTLAAVILKESLSTTSAIGCALLFAAMLLLYLSERSAGIGASS